MATGSYFLPRILIALIVPLTLASLGPATSHPELGTDMATTRKPKSEVYRANDVRMQVAIEQAQHERQITKLQAFRRGQKMHFKRKED